MAVIGVQWKEVYAICMETAKYRKELAAIAEAVPALHKLVARDDETYWLVLVLLYERALGRGPGKTNRDVVAAQVRSAGKDVDKIVQDRYGGSEALRKVVAARGMRHPFRYARVNPLRVSMEEAARQLARDGFTRVDQPEETDCVFWEDGDVPALLGFPPGTDLHDNRLVRDGSLVLQDKGSAFAALVLNPGSNWDVLDACAAPGSKTTHLVSLMQTKAQGTAKRGLVYALDKDHDRLETLRGRVELQGASQFVSPSHEDCLKVNFASDKRFKDLKAVLLDPSCSGSGLHFREDLVDRDEAQASTRLNSLAAFQETILATMLTIPTAKRLTYSTCSIHIEENEQVVHAVLEQARDLGWRLEKALPEWERRGETNVFAEADKCVRTDPEHDRTGGFFLALFVREVAQERQKRIAEVLGQSSSGKGERVDGNEGFKRRTKKSTCKARFMGKPPRILTVATERQGVVLLPYPANAGSHLGDAVTLAHETASLSASGGETSPLAMLHDRLGNPVDSWVTANGLMAGVNQNDLIVLVNRVLVDPVRVEHAHVAALASGALLGDGALVPRKLELRNTLVLRLAVLNTLGHRALPPTAAHPHAVHHVSLLRLVANAAGLVRSRRPRRAVDCR
eukprot:CAMPEP_0198367052 /NCGR_PEP_ID=MMETSP1450-20131203/154992_1 /TAXON_ID=753684 ORGANISM="Madagascaria erythrocladiodes, Strain CCMP3234" /NCGR_SAMPLE_ID=MMETSP1450 /ASSEMBLY_ACC=CAM_ASM_001115 /LENGTH=624 /DNA_ID=CAMNT_0044074527 /DNA_START=21 /DNA_END=1897 /DNA_ORIENTATION=-